MNKKLLIIATITFISASLVYAAVNVLPKEMGLMKASEPTKTQSNTQTEPLNVMSSSTPTKTIQNTQSNLRAKIGSESEILTASDLTLDKEKWIGEHVRVHGEISVNISHGERQCPIDNAECDTVMNVQLELWDQESVLGIKNHILLFSNNLPYICPKSASYTCPPFTNGEIIVVEGVWSKDQVAVSWKGGSGLPIPTEWRNRYFLNLK